MKKLNILFIALVIFGCSNAQNFHHNINAKINIEKQFVEAYDTITVPDSYIKEHDTIYFYLNGKFTVRSISPAYVVIPAPTGDTNVSWQRYSIRINLPDEKQHLIPLLFSGIINEEIQEDAVSYARGFSTTSGIISEKGVYIAGSTLWIPTFEDELFSFRLTVTINNKDWGVVSQGTRTLNKVVGETKVIRYESPDLMDEVQLIAAKFTEYNKETDHVLLQAFLREPDEELANRYLDVTVDYLKLFEDLLGKYPYTKFSLVENFWNTGYGMPSFTLLGSDVIRFPFILHSSYPHELLHNWWGNSVYVNYEKGNWCEGLTAYMADHLTKEQQGQGSEYRRGTLEKYTSYVNEENEFPISEFGSRSNAAEEAIGYGKVLMVNDMLRYEVGDENFVKAYRKFYADNKFYHASFDDIRKVFEEVTGKDFKAFFDQWILRKGAPSLQLTNVSVSKAAPYQVTFTIKQTQKEDVFTLKVPVAIYLEGDEKVDVRTVEMKERETTLTYSFDKKPVKVDVDPQYNVFRRLDKNEIPPSIAQLFGAQEASLILPKSSPLFEEYAKLADIWRQMQEAQGKKLTVVNDADITELPSMPVWVLGFENTFADNNLIKTSYSSVLNAETLSTIDTISTKGSLIYAYVNSSIDNNITGFLGTTLAGAAATLTRKLTHYGKYSYLGFEGADGKNVLKGNFPVLTSPLSFQFEYDGEKLAIPAILPERSALVQ